MEAEVTTEVPMCPICGERYLERPEYDVYGTLPNGQQVIAAHLHRCPNDCAVGICWLHPNVVNRWQIEVAVASAEENAGVRVCSPFVHGGTLYEMCPYCNRTGPVRTAAAYCEKFNVIYCYECKRAYRMLKVFPDGEGT